MEEAEERMKKEKRFKYWSEVLFCTSCNRPILVYCVLVLTDPNPAESRGYRWLVVDPPACSHSHTLGDINERSRPDNFQRATLLSPLFV